MLSIPCQREMLQATNKVEPGPMRLKGPITTFAITVVSIGLNTFPGVEK